MLHLTAGALHMEGEEERLEGLPLPGVTPDRVTQLRHLVLARHFVLRHPVHVFVRHWGVFWFIFCLKNGSPHRQIFLNSSLGTRKLFEANGK